MSAQHSAETGRFVRVPIKERFLSYVIVNPISGCWNWLRSSSGVRDIMDDHRLQRVIATDYGVHKSTVCHIKTKRIWRHLWQ